jgi:hypothetical protein
MSTFLLFAPDKYHYLVILNPDDPLYLIAWCNLQEVYYLFWDRRSIAV